MFIPIEVIYRQQWFKKKKNEDIAKEQIGLNSNSLFYLFKRYTLIVREKVLKWWHNIAMCRWNIINRKLLSACNLEYTKKCGRKYQHRIKKVKKWWHFDLQKRLLEISTISIRLAPLLKGTMEFAWRRQDGNEIQAPIHLQKRRC